MINSCDNVGSGMSEAWWVRFGSRNSCYKCCRMYKTRQLSGCEVEDCQQRALQREQILAWERHKAEEREEECVWGVWGSRQTGHSPIPPRHACLDGGSPDRYLQLWYMPETDARKQIDNIWRLFFFRCFWRNITENVQLKNVIFQSWKSMSPRGKPSGKQLKNDIFPIV